MGANVSASQIGSFGLQNMIDISSSAYVSSTKANSAMVGRLFSDHAYELPIDAALATFIERLNATPPDTQTSKQTSWTEKIQRHTQLRLLQRTTDTELARYKGASCTGSGDWLNALPSLNLGLEMSDDCF